MSIPTAVRGGDGAFPANSVPGPVTPATPAIGPKPVIVGAPPVLPAVTASQPVVIAQGDGFTDFIIQVSNQDVSFPVTGTRFQVLDVDSPSIPIGVRFGAKGTFNYLARGEGAEIASGFTLLEFHNPTGPLNGTNTNFLTLTVRFRVGSDKWFSEVAQIQQRDSITYGHQGIGGGLLSLPTNGTTFLIPQELDLGYIRAKGAANSAIGVTMRQRSVIVQQATGSAGLWLLAGLSSTDPRNPTPGNNTYTPLAILTTAPFQVDTSDQLSIYNQSGGVATFTVGSIFVPINRPYTP